MSTDKNFSMPYHEAIVLVLRGVNDDGYPVEAANILFYSYAVLRRSKIPGKTPEEIWENAEPIVNELRRTLEMQQGAALGPQGDITLTAELLISEFETLRPVAEAEPAKA